VSSVYILFGNINRMTSRPV